MFGPAAVVDTRSETDRFPIHPDVQLQSRSESGAHREIDSHLSSEEGKKRNTMQPAAARQPNVCVKSMDGPFKLEAVSRKNTQ